MCNGRPLLLAKLYPSLNTIPKKCVRENSLQVNNKEGMCYGKPLLHVKLHPGLNIIPHNRVRENSLHVNSKEDLCYGRPLLLAKLHPGLNTIPNNCVRENSFQLNRYGIGLSSGRSIFESCPVPVFLLCICSFVHFLWIFFVRISPFRSKSECTFCEG